MRSCLGLLTALLLAGPAGAVPTRPPAVAPAAPASPTARADAERPHIVLLSVEAALPADSSEARAFIMGVREAFEPDFYLTEGLPGGPPRVSRALTNRFRLVHGEPFGDEWQVRVTIAGRTEPGAAGRDSTGGLRVGVAIRSPEEVESGARPATVEEALSLDGPLTPRSAWCSRAGRLAGLLAVEALHRRSGHLERDTRVRMDGAVRGAIETRAPSAPAR